MNRYVNAKLSGAALTSLPLTPIEGFVLSRIEGESTEEDVAHAAAATPGGCGCGCG
jgi:hypothetical protein